jgi:protein SCO1
MKKTASLLLVAGLVTAALAGAWVASRTSARSPPKVALRSGTLLAEPQPLPSFSLTTHTGAAFDETDLRGRWHLVFFGFTHCPGVCPATLTLLNDVRARLGMEQLGVVLVSIDPERDTPVVMAKYLAAFQPPILGLTGSGEAIDALAAGVGVAHRKIEMADGEYMVDHTAAVFVIDPEGRRAAVFTPPLAAAPMAEDLRRLF